MDTVKITIDDRELTVPAGTTILRAARDNGLRIPTLCFLEKINPRANCRMASGVYGALRTASSFDAPATNS